jgi:short-subunit dehydrogenase
VRLDAAVALVTGGSSGIGAAVATRLAGRGARVLVAGRDPAATERVARAAGGTPYVADLSTADGPAELAARAGAVDLLVASAGTGWKGPFAEMPASTLDQLITVNVRAPLALTRALLPGMLARGRGHIALVGSIAGLTGVASESGYAATKAAVLVFAESLRLELAGTGVGVTVVSPGVVDTPFFQRRGVPYDRRTPRPIPADRVAAALVRAIEHDRAEVIVPRWLGIAPRVRGMAPGVYRALARRFG